LQKQPLAMATASSKMHSKQVDGDMHKQTLIQT